MNNKHIFALLICISGCLSSLAQIEDFQVWGGIELDYELNKKTTFYLEQEYRMSDNVAYLSRIITVAGGGYEFNKYITLRGFYRFTYGYDLETQQESDQRLFADLILKKKVSDRLKISYRSRYQFTFGGYQGKEMGTTPIQYWRNKFNVKYNVPKVAFNPYAAIEFYYSMNNPMGNEFDKYRITLGTDYKFNKKLAVKAFYRYQKRRVAYKVPLNIYILGLGLNYSF